MNNILFWIILIIGLFYTFMPHNVHMMISPDYTLSNIRLPHYIHILIGIALLVIAYINLFK